MLVNYTITKREVVVNGITKVFKRVIGANDVKPFFELFLPEKNVLGITSVLLKNGTQYTNTPSTSEFLGVDNKWYEVDALAEDRVFIEDPAKVSDQPGIKVGRFFIACLPNLSQRRCLSASATSGRPCQNRQAGDCSQYANGMNYKDCSDPPRLRAGDLNYRLATYWQAS